MIKLEYDNEYNSIVIDLDDCMYEVPEKCFKEIPFVNYLPLETVLEPFMCGM